MRNIQISRYCHTEIGMWKSHGSNKGERAMHTPSAQANSLPSTTARHLKARWRLTVPYLTTLRSSKAGKDFIASNDSTAIRDRTPRKESEKEIINLKWILMRSVRRMFVDLEAHYCESEHCRVFTGRPANVYIQIWIVFWASGWIECVFCVFVNNRESWKCFHSYVESLFQNLVYSVPCTKTCQEQQGRAPENHKTKLLTHSLVCNIYIYIYIPLHLQHINRSS